MNTPDNDTPIRFSMEPETFIDINHIASEQFGAPFAELANRDPLAAYRLFRKCSLVFAALADEANNIGQFMPGGERTNEPGPVTTAIETKLPETPTTRLRLSLKIFDIMDEAGTELPRVRGRSATEIVGFVVEPPSYI